mmetsp:Transcript_9629/g.23343  ORF Transcript_9629/g.23343 Transcript_9629/m.23343 type:complete len:808 (+) Transcript_9629:204-2627(+)
MLRNRDVLALIATLILVRLAWNNGTDNLSAAVDLAFYFPRERVMVVSPMDVDGDGTKEALAVVKAVEKKESFTMEIHDLKPLHGFRKTYLEPFRPKVIFSSEEIHDDHAHPIHLTTGQLLIKKHQMSGKEADEATTKKYHLSGDKNNNKDNNDRTRHYFCGTSWHDAASQCKTPCPSGQSHECPSDERCFADTPCDALSDAFDKDESQKNSFELTPGGGMPSVVSLWSNGVVILHSLTNTKEEGDEANNTKKKKKKKEKKPLELREMWRHRIFDQARADEMREMVWEEINVLFLDAYSSMEANSEHGMIVVTASYFLDGDPESSPRSTLSVAIDAFEGTILWESHSEFGLETEEKPMPLPMATRGQTSFARRRSSVARFMQAEKPSGASASALPNCMSLLKKAVKNEVFPYSYWGPQDAGVAAIHLNRRKDSRHNRNHRASKPHEEHAATPNAQHPHHHHHHHKARKWHHKFHPRKKSNRNEHHHNYEPIEGRPNALVTQTRGGLQIRSLKNGKALCHLALLEENLYSDLNNDGVLDQVQVALHSKTHRPDDKFIWKLAGKLLQDYEQKKSEKLKSGDTDSKELKRSEFQLCHVLALSGIPAKEEMFSAPICGSPSDRVIATPSGPRNLDAANPLVVEHLGRKGGKHDIVVALNNGMVHRINASKGRSMWKLSGAGKRKDFPTWLERNNHLSLLTRIQSETVDPSIRPLLLAGENGLAVLSVKTGHVLASAPFPQNSESKPILADLSGDGSTDVMIITRDGIWGYQIVVHRGSPVVQRILVGLLLMALMLATIKNRYSKGNKRSTDR